MKRLPVIAAVLVAAVVSLSGCAATVALTPAPHATSKLCADVVVHLPPTVSDLPQRHTNAQGTGAWGDPTAVYLRCGVAVPGPSTLPCVLVGGIYWLRDDSDAPNFSLTTYGRDPAVQVVVNDKVVAPGASVYDLENAVAFTKPTGHVCTSIEDSLGATPTPTATPKN